SRCRIDRIQTVSAGVNAVEHESGTRGSARRLAVLHGVKISYDISIRRGRTILIRARVVLWEGFNGAIDVKSLFAGAVLVRIDAVIQLKMRCLYAIDAPRHHRMPIIQILDLQLQSVPATHFDGRLGLFVRVILTHEKCDGLVRSIVTSPF